MSIASAIELPSEAEVDWLPGVVDEIVAANEALPVGHWHGRGRYALPSRAVVRALMTDLLGALFPGHFGATDLSPSNISDYVAVQFEKVRVSLAEQVRRSLALTCEHVGIPPVGECRACNQDATDVVEGFIRRLPAIRRLLNTDLQAAYASDPAARSLLETLYCYPGVLAITHHRIAHELHVRSVPLIPRIISELAHSSTGIDIHPGAEIGPHFFIDHGTGVVIGETCEIGARVRLYQGVTLGARRLAVDPDGFLAKGQPRHPIVRDDVVIYSGATILGRVAIGQGATIGGNVWLTRDVAPGARVTQAFLQHNAFEGGAGI